MALGCQLLRRCRASFIAAMAVLLLLLLITRMAAASDGRHGHLCCSPRAAGVATCSDGGGCGRVAHALADITGTSVHAHVRCHLLYTAQVEDLEVNQDEHLWCQSGGQPVCQISRNWLCVASACKDLRHQLPHNGLDAVC